MTTQSAPTPADRASAMPAVPVPTPVPRVVLLLLAACVLLPFIVYFPTALSIVSIWNSSGTFAHGYVILPICGWLVWQRRAAVAHLPLTPYWPALLALAACGAAWLLAELGEVQIVRHYAFAAMLPLIVLVLCGKQVAKALAFPLAFILFAVPFGDVFISPLIGITADFTVFALRATGIPVLRDGASFSIPSGNWSVVDACSGVRYLIASVTLGSLYAYLTFRSTWRRALFVLASILVPIAANGARAYMIVMLGHLSGMTLAVGVDHIIYGWLFFGLVMFVLFWLGSLWREDNPHGEQAGTAASGAAAMPMGGAAAAIPHAPLARLSAAALAIALCIGVWPAYDAWLASNEPHPVPASLATYSSSWTAAPAFADWESAYPAATAMLRQTYQHDGIQPVGLELRYYSKQDQNTKLISSVNHLTQFNDGHWRNVDSALRVETVAGRQLTVRESSLVGPRGRLLVWNWYWVDGHHTSNDYLGKVLQIRQKILSGSDQGAALMLYAAYEEKPDAARAALRAYLSDNLARLDAALEDNKR
jgi:exosortase A